MKAIVRVENLSKQYRLGTKDAAYHTLRESLAGAVRAPFKRLTDRNGARNRDMFWALKDVNLELAPGEVLGVIGRNGAGKSTLLKVLSRIIEPTKGRAELFGRVASLLEVGTGFHPELTGKENIYLNGAILGMKKKEIDLKFDQMVAFAELDAFLDTPVKRYSSGMYMRLAFAVASHLEPEILLVDEVLAVGDAAFQKKCLGKMGSVARDGRTLLFVSHNMAAVRSLCARTIWLDKGQIIAAGETEQVVLDYLEQASLPVLEQVWDDPETAPGTDIVRLRSARVRGFGPHGRQEISIESQIEIEFDFWSFQVDEVLGVTMHLYTAEGICVFATGSGQKSRLRGLNRETLRIPARFLNDGTYVVTMQFVQNSSSLHLLPEVLVFEVLDSVREGNWFGKWPGVVRPRLEWMSETIVEAEVGS
ncbi:MAG TPA: ABC transporter ATP-binding protein [Pyrinomonadaceae bacterium]|nr:ABC transporter ATP-binding protein [Pyrinomonadaceae bacterium]